MINLNKAPLPVIDKKVRVGWSPEMIEYVANAKRQGLSAGRIADRIEARFGVVYSRNAIMGVLRRIKNNPGHKPNQPRAQPAPTAAQTQAPPAGHPLHGLPLIVRAPNPAPLLRADGQPHDTLSISSATCKWPVSGAGGHTAYCGHAQAVGGAMPYCEVHMARASAPKTAKGTAE